MNKTVLEFKNVWKKFKKGEKYDSLRDLIPAFSRNLVTPNSRYDLREQEFWALKDISFSVKRGEALGIIGPNGAGKSTILKLFSRILRPNMGEIRLRGSLSALIEVGAGFHPDLTGRENIYLNAAILGMRKSEIEKKIDSIVDFSELHDFIDTPVKRYSSGMYARLGFSVAAHVEPDILLVDEVLSVGDFSFQHKCLNKMKDFLNNGTTIIFISHNIPSINMLCPNTILLNKGEIQQHGKTSDVVRYYYRAFSENRKTDESVLFKLKSIEMHTSDDKSTNTYHAGDWGKIKIRIESGMDIDKLILGVFIKNSQGMVVFDANSNKISNKYFSFQENSEKTIEFQIRYNLPEGSYYIGLHLMDLKGSFYIYEDEATEFNVISPMTMGNAFLDMIL